MPSNKFKCKICNYKTDRKDNYKRHISSLRHLKKIENKKQQESVICQFCGTIISQKYYLKRHYKTKLCQRSSNFKNKEKIDKLEEEMESMKKENKVLINYIKESSNKIEKKIDKLSNKTGNNINNGIIVFNSNYICKNFNDPFNYEELINQELTQEEIDKIKEYGLGLGREYLILKRCVNGMEVDQRPFHCVDEARKKFLLRTKDEWIKDPKGESILKYPTDLLQKKIYPVKSIEEIKELSLEELLEHNKNSKLIMDADKSKNKTIKLLAKKTSSKNTSSKKKNEDVESIE